MTLHVACPTCKTKTAWSKSNQNRPFCSHRCKLIDLGAWADESHVITTDLNESQADALLSELESQENI